MKKQTYRAGAIGHTGRGNFGHQLHLPLAQIDGIEVVAVADPDPEGRAAAEEAIGAAAGYADYREMLAKESLDIVVVCPRWTDQRVEMVRACAAAGAHVYCEKPLARSLAEADAILSAVDEAGIKLAVAHQAVYLPQIQEVRRQIERGIIGEIESIRAYGKQDHRGGGEDMLVLGTHLFNLMRYFAGDVAWMWAHVTSAGRDIRSEDVHEATEPVGLVAGDAVTAYYSFRNGVRGHFESRKGNGGNEAPRPYGMEIVGSKGRIAFNGEAGTFSRYPYAAWTPWNAARGWQPLSVETASLMDGNYQALLDLIEAVETNRDPISSGHDARAALEMIVGAYASQIQKERVAFPLANRTHPLVDLQRRGGAA